MTTCSVLSLLWLVERCKSLNLGFENDDFKKRSSLSIWMENTSMQTKNCVAVFLMMASIVFGSLVRQVWPSVA